MQFTQFCRNPILRLKFETSPLSADNVNWVTRWYWFIHTNYMVELVHTEDRNWVYKNQKIIKTQADWFEFPDYLYWIANCKLLIRYLWTKRLENRTCVSNWHCSNFSVEHKHFVRIPFGTASWVVIVSASTKLPGVCLYRHTHPGLLYGTRVTNFQEKRKNLHRPRKPVKIWSSLDSYLPLGMYVSATWYDQKWCSLFS